MILKNEDCGNVSAPPDSEPCPLHPYLHTPKGSEIKVGDIPNPPQGLAAPEDLTYGLMVHLALAPLEYRQGHLEYHQEHLDCWVRLPAV